MSSSTLELIRPKTRRREDPDQEGWMVSYADLITLLFIFFSVILSISNISKAKFESLTRQFNQNTHNSLTELQGALDSEMARSGLQGQVRTVFSDEGLQVQFNEAVLFETGDARINQSGLPVMARFAKILKGMGDGFHLAIEGHTDDRPIHTAEYPSNWSLSATRAVNVLHFLAEQGVEAKRMMVRAYADTRPVSTDANQRSLNRRVTLLVY
jgi:chemotaxis protein MotB